MVTISERVAIFLNMPSRVFEVASGSGVGSGKVSPWNSRIIWSIGSILGYVGAWFDKDFLDISWWCVIYWSCFRRGKR